MRERGSKGGIDDEYQRKRTLIGGGGTFVQWMEWSPNKSSANKAMTKEKPKEQWEKQWADEPEKKAMKELEKTDKQFKENNRRWKGHFKKLRKAKNGDKNDDCIKAEHLERQNE